MPNILTFNGADGEEFSIHQKELTDKNRQQYVADKLGISIEDLRSKVADANATRENV
jgi:hypothetical protein